MQISEKVPLSKMSHYVAGIDIPSTHMTAVAAATLVESAFAAFYLAVGVHDLPTVTDGDCGLDVMCLMMGVERNQPEHTPLRGELGDYLMDCMHDAWMIDILRLASETNPENVKLARSDEIQVGQESVPPPNARDTGVADIALDDGGELEHVSEEAMNAMRWASNIEHDSSVLALVRPLPIHIVQEQIRCYNARGTEVTASGLPIYTIGVGVFPSVKCRHAVAKRFHKLCDMRRLTYASRLPRGAMVALIAENLSETSKAKKLKEKAALRPKRLDVSKWHTTWLMEQHDGVTAVAARSLLKSRAPQTDMPQVTCGWRGQTLQSPSDQTRPV